MVPPQPAAGKDGAAPRKVVDDDAAPAVERQSSSSSSAGTKPWWWTALLSPTRGAVGLVIGGLVVLALLVGATWIDLDAVSIHALYLQPLLFLSAVHVTIYLLKSIV